ncbi:MAG: hypothetical protein ABIL69_10550 [candidate division WOR-3 bacterium]
MHSQNLSWQTLVCNKNCSGRVYSAIINVEQAQPLQDGMIDNSSGPWSASRLVVADLGLHIFKKSGK